MYSFLSPPEETLNIISVALESINLGGNHTKKVNKTQFKRQALQERECACGFLNFLGTIGSLSLRFITLNFRHFLEQNWCNHFQKG